MSIVWIPQYYSMPGIGWNGEAVQQKKLLLKLSKFILVEYYLVTYCQNLFLRTYSNVDMRYDSSKTLLLKQTEHIHRSNTLKPAIKLSNLALYQMKIKSTYRIQLLASLTWNKLFKDPD